MHKEFEFIHVKLCFKVKQAIKSQEKWLPFGGAVSGKEQEGASEDPVSVLCLSAGCMVCLGK